MELEQEKHFSPLPPVIIGGALILPASLLSAVQTTGEDPDTSLFARETKEMERIAMEAVMRTERDLEHVPKDVSQDNCGYDIESSSEGHLRFLEVKGRRKGSITVTVTKNEILKALNTPDNYRLVLVEVDGEDADVTYFLKPFIQPPDFASASVNFNITQLMLQGTVELRRKYPS